MADYKAFAKDVMRDWPEGHDLDADDLQNIAIKHGILVPVEGGFDPDKHECPYDLSERGDPCYIGVWAVEKETD